MNLPFESRRIESGTRLSSGLERAKGHAHRTKECGIRLLRRITIDVAAPGDFKSFEAGLKDFLRELCFQQSTGNSAGPEFNPSFGAFGHGFLHEDVCHLQSTARLEHTIQLGEYAILIG